MLYRDAGHVPLKSYFLAVSLVFLPFLFAAVLWIKDLLPPFWDHGARLANFEHVRQFGEFGFFAAASATGLGVLSRRMVVPSCLLAAAALFGIVMTGCRGAMLSWILFVLLLCCVVRRRLRTAMLAFWQLAPVALLVWQLDHSGVFRSPNVFSRIDQVVQNGGAGFDSGRIAIWIASLKQIAIHPFFGSGPEGYRLSGCCDQAVLQAHNFILQFLMEFGAVGCGIMLLLMNRVTRHLGGIAGLRSLAGSTTGTRVLACMIAAYLAYSLIDQTMYHLLPLLLIAPVAGLFAAGLAQARSAATAPQ